MAQCDELAQHHAPLSFAEVRADPERAQAGVVVLRDLLGRLAAQHIDQVSRPEALSVVLVKAVDARQGLASGLGGVPGGWRVLAVVAGILVSAAGVAFLTEIRQQSHATAVVGLCQRQQGIELAALPALEFLRGRALVDHPALVHHIRQPVGHPRVGRQTVAPGTAGLLVVALDCSSEDPGVPRSARRACRCPCRRRSWPPSPDRPRARSGPGGGGAGRRPGLRGTAAQGCRPRTARPPSRRLSCVTGSTRCRRHPRAHRAGNAAAAGRASSFSTTA